MANPLSFHSHKHYLILLGSRYLSCIPLGKERDTTEQKELFKLTGSSFIQYYQVGYGSWQDQFPFHTIDWVVLEGEEFWFGGGI